MANRRAGSKWRRRLLVVFVLLMTAGVGFILASDVLLTRRLTAERGQAASTDIAAPHRIEFLSEILTETERKRALADVNPVYDPLDRQVGRAQVDLVLQIMSFIDSVRADPYASPEYRRFCLENIEHVDLSPQIISSTLQLAEDQWKTVQTESRAVLSRIMQDEIKSGQEDTARRDIRAMVALDLNEPQTAIVDVVASGLVKANRVYNPEATELARQDALAGVEPQMRVLEENQIIVRSGEIVTDLDIEALDALGLLTSEIDWVTISGVFLLAFLLAVVPCVYIWHYDTSLLDSPHHLLLLLLLILVFTLFAKWGLSLSSPSQPYMVPLATLGVLVTVLFGVRLGLVTHALSCLIIAYMTGGHLGLLAYELSGGLVGLFALRQVKRINSFVWAGAYVMLVNAVTVIVFALLGDEVNTLLAGELVLAGMINGALSAVLALGGYYLLGMVFNITTTLQLLDLARATHPAMQELLLKAPGTYHHSFMVANMSEQAAEAIGAHALLARVGAIYHDIGKTIRPYFFTENQMEGANPHDLMDPGTSAQIIRSHTRDGLELAQRYRLPKVIRAFITEHHGTSKIGYFYHKAVQEYGEDEVDAADYIHLGPTPQTKETSIVMLADSCEAAVRSVRQHDVKELESLIQKIVAGKLSSGQLNNAPLTLREIDTIASSFVDTLQGAFHPRIRYPSGAGVSLPERGQIADQRSLEDGGGGTKTPREAERDSGTDSPIS